MSLLLLNKNIGSHFNLRNNKTAKEKNTLTDGGIVNDSAEKEPLHGPSKSHFHALARNLKLSCLDCIPHELDPQLVAEKEQSASFAFSSY